MQEALDPEDHAKKMEMSCILSNSVQDVIRKSYALNYQLAEAKIKGIFISTNNKIYRWSKEY